MSEWVSEIAQSRPILCDPMDCNPPGSSVHGILQARKLEWGALSFSRGSSRPRDQTLVSCITGGFFTFELPGKPINWLEFYIKNFNTKSEKNVCKKRRYLLSKTLKCLYGLKTKKQRQSSPSTEQRKTSKNKNEAQQPKHNQPQERVYLPKTQFSA